MLDIAPQVCVVFAVLVVFGLPFVLTVSPPRWRRWWPLSAPIYGLAGLAALLLPFGTLFSPGKIAVPVLIGTIAISGVLWRKCGPLPAPSVASIVVLVSIVPAGLLAYRPTLRLQEPRPSGVLNEDSIYYLSIDTWLQRNGVRDEPPRPEVDGFFAPAHAAWSNHLRVGVDLVNVQVATVLGTDPLETLPALSAVLVGLIGAGSALAVISLRGPPWAAALAAVVVTSRPETIRLGLDSFVAQSAGLILVPVAGSAMLVALIRGGTLWGVSAGIFAAALCAYYVEYVPWLVMSGTLLLALRLLAPRWSDAREEVRSCPSATRSQVLRRVFVIVLAGVLSNPLAIYNGVRSLAAGTDLTGETVVPFYGILRSLGLVTGPLSVIREAPDASLYLAVAASVTLLAALPHLTRPIAIGLLAMLVAVGIFALQQAYLQDYSYGLYKILGLAAPIAAITLVFIVAGGSVPFGLRAAGGAIIAGLLLLNASAAIGVSRSSVGAVNGMIPEDDDLRRVPSLLPSVKQLALEGTDAAGTPNARQHYGVYFLRKYNRQLVTYARGTGSYYLTSLEGGPADVDQTYSPNYGGVVSWGPSLTQTDLVAQLGGWHVYRRPRGPNLLLVGRKGWNFMTSGPGGRPMRWTRGPAVAWINATQPARVRLRIEVTAPFRTQPISVMVGRRIVLSRRVTTSPIVLMSSTFAVPRGRTVVSFGSDAAPGPSGEDALGVGFLSAQVEVVGS